MGTPTRPLPHNTQQYITDQGRPGKDFYNWLSSVQQRLNPIIVDLGTAAGTITPNPSVGTKQRVTNKGAFTIAATSELGDFELEIVNGSGAGAITFSGFTKQYTGDTLTTTLGNRFVIFIYGWGSDGCDYMIKARQ